MNDMKQNHRKHNLLKLFKYIYRNYKMKENFQIKKKTVILKP